MIPKIIHCVWLSGDEKHELHKKCMASWKEVMPEYEIKEWSLSNLPIEVLNHSFVKSALKYKKWAYATDYIRLWLLYTYGGLYLDLDVYVYKNFNVFLKHSAFSCIEFNPINFYKNVRKNNYNRVYGLNIEAAVIGAIKGHPWINDAMHSYDNVSFVNTENFMMKYIMPLILTKAAKKRGFKYIPIYQVLDDGVVIYPPDVFSSCYNTNILKEERYENYGNNSIRYSYHLCAHSWWENKTMTNNEKIIYMIKKTIINIFGKSLIHKLNKKNKF